MRALAIILALSVAPPAAADILPIKRGFYARIEKGCATHGNLAAYARLLTFHGNGLNDASHDRQAVGRRHSGSTYDLRLRSRNLGRGDERRLAWLVIVSGQDRFHLAGAERDGDWTGDYVFCGATIP